MLDVLCWLSVGGGCLLLFVAYCSLFVLLVFVVRCALCLARCSWVVFRGLLIVLVVRCWLLVVMYDMLFPRCRCLLFVVCC